jgi:hypothetical protein
MYLAGILALCALLHAPASGGMGSGPSPLAIADAHSIRQRSSAQEPAKPEPPSQASPAQDQSQPPSQPPQEPAQTQENPQAPSAGAPPANATPEKKPAPGQGSKSPAPHKATKKKRPAPSPAQEHKRKVVSHGSTNEPLTQLSPQITDEQAAHQRAVTDQLLASTDASLQRLSGRTLSKDQQDTVAQVRKFMEQVKAAQAAGDLQRAYKLAVKAHLLADALEKS